jgi:hypothetical protein
MRIQTSTIANDEKLTCHPSSRELSARAAERICGRLASSTLTSQASQPRVLERWTHSVGVHMEYPKHTGVVAAYQHREEEANTFSVIKAVVQALRAAHCTLTVARPHA